MPWIAGGFFVLGLACGAIFRLPFFAAVLVVAAVVIVASDFAHGAPTVYLDTFVGIVALQLGYGFGIGARAVAHARKHRRETMKRERGQYVSATNRGERH